MFRRRVLSSLLTLGMFIGACDMTSLYPAAMQPLGFDAFGGGKIAVQLHAHEDPPGGTNDPPPGSQRLFLPQVAPS